MGHDVFVSHSSKDKSVGDAVCAALEANGVRCWIAPRDIKPGESWAKAILRGIAECRMMVLVFSAHANGSPHICREVERAVNSGIPIAPLRIDDALPKDDLEYFLSSSHWMDALKPPLEMHLCEFARKVRGLLEAGGKPSAAAPALAAGVTGRQTPAVPVMPAPPAPARRLRRRRIPALLVGLLLVGAVAAGWAFRGELIPGFAPATRSEPALANNAKAFTNTLGTKFVRIEPGDFTMGSPVGEDGRQTTETQHRVKLTKAFMMATTPVTQSQWKAVMADNPAHFKGDDLPVEKVTWDDAVAFCKKLSKKEQQKYRLPTEAEWEYACRAGTTTAYYTGDGEAALKEAGWYKGDSKNQTHPVGQKKPNAWGLYDMHGNVFQWCSDFYGDYPAGNAVDPAGPSVGDSNASRVVRGGSWFYSPKTCRAAYRDRLAPDYRIYDVGLRLCLDF